MTSTTTTTTTTPNNNNSNNNITTPTKEADEEPVVGQSVDAAVKVSAVLEKAETVSAGGAEEEVGVKPEDPMEEDSVNPATVFCIRLKQPRSNLQHKMSVPELCRNFR